MTVCYISFHLLYECAKECVRVCVTYVFARVFFCSNFFFYLLLQSNTWLSNIYQLNISCCSNLCWRSFMSVSVSVAVWVCVCTFKCGCSIKSIRLLYFIKECVKCEFKSFSAVLVLCVFTVCSVRFKLNISTSIVHTTIVCKMKKRIVSKIFSRINMYFVLPLSQWHWQILSIQSVKEKFSGFVLFFLIKCGTYTTIFTIQTAKTSVNWK